jgi:hypothetical protein
MAEMFWREPMASCWVDERVLRKDGRFGGEL